MILVTLIVSPLLWKQQDTSSALNRFEKLSEEEKVETFQLLGDKLEKSQNIVLKRAGALLKIELEKEVWAKSKSNYVYSSQEYAPKLKLKDSVKKGDVLIKLKSGI